MVRKMQFKVESRKLKVILSVFLFLLLTFNFRLSTGLAQQPQAQGGQPIYAVNAKYVNGVGPGYWPTKGTGLTLNLTAGTAYCGSPPSVVTYAGGTLTMTASATNYVYLDPSNSCAPATNTTGAPIGAVPIANVVTGGSAITSIEDARTWSQPNPVTRGSSGVWSIPSFADSGGQVFNVKAPPYNACGDGTCDDTTAINAAIAAAITTTSSGTSANKGSTVLLPKGTYLLNSTTTDAYTTYALIVDHGLHLKIEGLGATLVYNVNTAANALELRGTASTIVEGIKFVSAHTAVGTGINLIRPTVGYGDPTQQNDSRNCEFSNFAVAVQNGNNDSNQVSENSFQNLILNVPSGGKGIVQRGTSNFNSFYRAITWYGPSSASATMLDLYNGTATFIRPDFELNGSNLGIKTESGFVGPVAFTDCYAEVSSDSDQFLLNGSAGAYLHFRGGNISFFGTGGSSGSPIDQFDVQAGGAFLFDHVNISSNGGGYEGFVINPATPPIIERFGGYWYSQIVFSGNTSNANLLQVLPSGIVNVVSQVFDNGARIDAGGAGSTNLQISLPTTYGGTPVAIMNFLSGGGSVRFGNASVATTIYPYTNNTGSLGSASYRWTSGYINALYAAGLLSTSANPAGSGVIRVASSDLAIAFRNNANSGDVTGLSKDTSDIVQIGGTPGMKTTGPITPASYAYSALPACSTTPKVIYCTDCNSTCTAGSSTGRTCFCENSAWTH